MSRRFKLILFVRFFGYLIFFTGFLGFIFVLGPLFQTEVRYGLDKVFGVKRTVAVSNGSFGTVNASENTIIPVSTQYGIVIEKINANARIIPGVDPANEREYTRALSQGVAEALGSTPPGKTGNLYLFSHSTDAPWNIIRHNAVFFLLKELEPGDQVIVFYKDKRYDYVVFDKSIVSPADVSFLINRYERAVLTLQTCDPPGTLINRLIVRAKLVSSQI